VRRITLLLILGLAFASTGPLVAQGVTESLEREARSAFRGGRFKEAATKFQDAALSAAEMARRGKMDLQAAWAHFNDRAVKSAREALRRAFGADPSLEVVPEFFSPDFLKMVDEVRSSLRPSQAAPPPADLGELKRVCEEKLADGQAAEVVYDLTNLPAGALDSEGWLLLGRAYDVMKRGPEAADARRRAGLMTSPATTPVPTPSPAAAPSRTSPTYPAVPAPLPAIRPAPAQTPSATAPISGSTPTAGAVDRAAGAITEILAGGRTALQRGDAFMAQSAANRAIELDPNSSEAYRLLGDSYSLRNELVLAEANWKQSLKLNDKNEATLLALSEFQLAEKNWAASIEYLSRAVSLNPSHSVRLVALGRKARKGNDFAHAIEVFAQAAAASPDDPALLTEFAALLVESGQIDKAIDPLMHAAAVLPSSVVVRANLAGVLRRKGQRREAEREYREALRIEPGYIPALGGLAVLLMENGRAREAASLFEKVCQHDSKNPESLLGLARARRASDGLSAAAAVLETAAPQIDDGDVWNEAGSIAYERKRYAEAIAFFDKALRRKSDSKVFLANRARAAAAADFVAKSGIEIVTE
jgi:tetratricopeptide (TPR) repeat protein